LQTDDAPLHWSRCRQKHAQVSDRDGVIRMIYLPYIEISRCRRFAVCWPGDLVTFRAISEIFIDHGRFYLYTYTKSRFCEFFWPLFGCEVICKFAKSEQRQYVIIFCRWSDLALDFRSINITSIDIIYFRCRTLSAWRTYYIGKSYTSTFFLLSCIYRQNAYRNCRLLGKS